MSTETLLQRAKVFASGPAAALAAIVPLASAPTANAAILNQTSDVTAAMAFFIFEASTEYVGGPLGVVPGTNGTNEVRLSTLGSLSAVRPASGGGSVLQSHLAFVNTGTLAAAAGDVLVVSYDFSLTPALFFGGIDPVASEIGWSLTATLDSGASAQQSGGAVAAASGTTLDFMGSFDVASFATDTIDGFTLLLDIYWTIPIGFARTTGALAVDVPADSIDLRLVAEGAPTEVPAPGTVPLMLAGLVGLLVSTRQRRQG